MSIKIEFLLRGQSHFICKEISFEEYFDLEENELVEINSIPKFSQPYQYLNIDLKELLLIIASIEVNNETRILKQTFWNNGNNILTERIDIGIENYKEMILSFKIDEKKNIYETLRLFLGDKFTVPTYHSLIHSDGNGEDIENRFDTNVYIEMIKKGLIN